MNYSFNMTAGHKMTQTKTANTVLHRCSEPYPHRWAVQHTHYSALGSPLDSKPAEIFSTMEIACHIQLHPDKKSWRAGGAAQRCPVQRHSPPPCKKLLMTTTKDFTEIEYEMI